MLSGNLLLQCKQRMLGILDNYTIEVREQQLVSDIQLQNPSLKPDDARQSLTELEGDGLAKHHFDRLTGHRWQVTPEGHKAAAALELEA